MSCRKLERTMACGTARTCLCGLCVEGKHRGKCRQCLTKPKYLPAQRSFEIEALLRVSEAKARSKQCLPGSCSQDDLALTVSRRSRSAERCDGSRVKLCASPAGEFGTPTMRRIMTRTKVPSSESCSTPLSCGYGSTMAIGGPLVASNNSSAVATPPPPPPLAAGGAALSSSSSSSLFSSSSAAVVALAAAASMPVVTVVSGGLHHQQQQQQQMLASVGARLSSSCASLSSTAAAAAVTGASDPSEHIYETIGSSASQQQSKCASSPPPPYDGSSSSICSSQAAAVAVVGVGAGKRMISMSRSSTYSSKMGLSTTPMSSSTRPRPPRLPPSYDELELNGRLESLNVGNAASEQHSECGGNQTAARLLCGGGTYPKMMSKEDKAELKRLMREVEAEQERKEMLARIATTRRMGEQSAQGCSCTKCQQMAADAQYYGPNPPYDENDLSSAVFPMETQVLMQDIMTDGLSLCSMM